MAKIKTKTGYRFIKELGGAIRHQDPSFAASWLVENQPVKDPVLDFGCGHGYDADHFGWSGYDPYYRQQEPEGTFNTVICNRVLNMLTRESRQSAIESIRRFLSDDGIAWLVVPRNIPVIGKLGARKRIQNYVVLDLPSVYKDERLEIYQLTATGKVNDKTQEIELRLGNK